MGERHREENIAIASERQARGSPLRTKENKKKASKHRKTYTEFPVLCQLYELGIDYRHLHIWHCFLFMFLLLLTLQTLQSGIRRIKVKILYDAVVLCLYHQTSWIYLLQAQKSWKTKFRAATCLISPWLHCLNFYIHVKWRVYRYSPSKLEVSVKLTMPKKQSPLPSHGGLAVSLHMLKRSSDSWRGHCKWGKKRVLSPLPNGSN